MSVEDWPEDFCVLEATTSFAVKEFGTVDEGSTRFLEPGDIGM